MRHILEDLKAAFFMVPEGARATLGTLFLEGGGKLAPVFSLGRRP
jgi:hypothetical protein